MLLLYKVYEILAENNLNSNLQSLDDYCGTYDLYGVWASTNYGGYLMTIPLSIPIPIIDKFIILNIILHTHHKS